MEDASKSSSVVRNVRSAEAKSKFTFIDEVVQKSLSNLLKHESSGGELWKVGEYFSSDSGGNGDDYGIQMMSAEDFTVEGGLAKIDEYVKVLILNIL